MSETQKTTLPIFQMAKENEDFRKVILTGDKAQVVLMAIPVGEEIGNEVHEGHDQILWFVEGEGVAKIGDVETSLKEGDMSFVASGKYHNFKNTGDVPLKLFTTYSPPEHDEGTEHHTRKEAEQGD